MEARRRGTWSIDFVHKLSEICSQLIEIVCKSFDTGHTDASNQPILQASNHQKDHDILSPDFERVKLIYQKSCSSWKNIVKLMIVPYIRRPPIIDITMAGI